MNDEWDMARCTSSVRNKRIYNEFFFLDSSIMEMAKCLDT